MSEQLSDGMPSAFAMVPVIGAVDPVLEALREGRLLPRDVAVLWAVLQHIDWRSGRIWLSARQVGEALGHPPGNDEAARSLNRLRKAGLLARGADKRDPSRVFWCVDPSVASTGGKHRRLQQRLQFLEATA
jgi:hypothetical protein